MKKKLARITNHFELAEGLYGLVGPSKNLYSYWENKTVPYSHLLKAIKRGVQVQVVDRATMTDVSRKVIVKVVCLEYADNEDLYKMILEFVSRL